MRRLHAMTVSVATAPTMREALITCWPLPSTCMAPISGTCSCSIERRSSSASWRTADSRQSFSNGSPRSTAATAPHAAGPSGRVEIVQIEDVAKDPGYAPYRAVAEQAGYRSVQSVPLVRLATAASWVFCRSTFASRTHFPTATGTLGDMLARQAADLIDRAARSTRMFSASTRRCASRTGDLEASQEQLSRQAADLEQQDRHRRRVSGGAWPRAAGIRWLPF